MKTPGYLQSPLECAKLFLVPVLDSAPFASSPQTTAGELSAGNAQSSSCLTGRTSGLPPMFSYYPEAELIRVVVDNLNTHTPAALYETFPPHEAHRIIQRLDFHYTPKHGSWLNMVEIELSVLAGQCLERRLPDKATVQREIAAWERHRNDAKATVQWRFTTEQARTKLQRLYPSQSVR